MKRALLLVVAIAAIAAIPANTVVAGSAIPVCHFDRGSNGYEDILVGSQNSADTHVANHQYGDGGDYYGPCSGGA